jgi:hypothetical protein
MPIARPPFASATLAVALTAPVHADTDTLAIDRCLSAINERLGVQSLTFAEGGSPVGTVATK